MTTRVRSSEPAESSPLDEFRSFVPGTVFVPETEFEGLYAAYAADCQKRGRIPLSPVGFQEVTKIAIF